ncbi:RUN and FYVE domain-containing protein 2 [Schistosoma japonicum]|nr:RUN and FYVE domain-containing protein 2 [Schistosoma japonicum]
MEIERSNLLSILKLVVRDLMEPTFGQQQVSIDESIFWDNPATVHNDDAPNIVWRLLSVIEHCLCHGLRREYTVPDPINNSSDGTVANELIRNTTAIIRKAHDHVVSTTNIFAKHSSHPNPWPVLLEIEKLSSTTDPISNTVTTISEIRTGLGLSRVWLRHALMRKQLGEFFQIMIDYISDSNSSGSLHHSPDDHEFNPMIHVTQNPSKFGVFYHPDALLLNNEGVVLTGLLATLKCIDFCFILKDNLSYMDKPLYVIPYHIYLQTNVDRLEKLHSKANLFRLTDSSSSIDQKNFLEDLCNVLKKRINRVCSVNHKLNNEITNLSKQMESMKLENRSLHITVAELKKDQIGLDTMHSENIETISRMHKIESELMYYQNAHEESSELVESLRNHLDESNKRCKQLARYLSDSESSLEQKRTIFKQLEVKSKGMISIIEQMKERIANLSNEKISHERDLCKLREQLSNANTKLIEQSKVTENQTSQIEILKAELNKQTIQLNDLKITSDELALHKSKVEELDKQLKVSRKRCEEQERSLCEMAVVVNSSKLEAESLRESYSAFNDAKWANDSENPNCFLCQCSFSVSRRRHHCRNCGLIFCHECSSRKMTLPSSAKPVRICDTCHALLLHRYSAK